MLHVQSGKKGRMKTLINRAKKRGQSLVEYGMMVALVAIVAMVVVKATGTKTTTTFDNVQSQMTAQGIATTTPQTPSGSTDSRAARTPVASPYR